MASKFFERRAIRNQLKTYLESRGWVNLTWTEGFSEDPLPSITTPLISIYLDDLGREELEMGRDPNINKVFTRRVQVTVLMESEDRVNAITDDISDFMDMEVVIIKDNNQNSLGTLISDTSSILGETYPPSLQEEQLLMWEGIMACTYEAHYPNG